MGKVGQRGAGINILSARRAKNRVRCQIINGNALLSRFIAFSLPETEPKKTEYGNDSRTSAVRKQRVVLNKTGRGRRRSGRGLEAPERLAVTP